MSWCPATLITAIHFCLALQTLTSSKLPVCIRIDQPVLWRSHHRHLLAVTPLLHFPSLVMPVKFRLDFKICLLTYKTLLVKKQTRFICSPCLPHHSHPIRWDPTRESLYRFPGLRPMPVQGHFALAPQPCGTTSRYQSARLPLLQLLEMSKDSSLCLGLSPIVTNTPNGPLMSWTVLWISLLDIDLAVTSTGPGLARDIGQWHSWNGGGAWALLVPVQETCAITVWHSFSMQVVHEHC